MCFRSWQIRCATLYSGPQNDEAALAIRACRPDGPLMMLVGRMHVSCDLLLHASPWLRLLFCWLPADFDAALGLVACCSA